MAICNDPALTYLKGLGYNVVRLPSAKLQPMDIIGRDRGSIDWLGPAESLCESSLAMPASEQDPTPSIKVTTTGTFTLNVGLQILRGLLAPFGAHGAGVDAAYSDVRHLEFSFEHPVVRSIAPAAIGKWLLTAPAQQGNPFVKRYFGSRECTTCIVSEVLMSRSFTVSAFDKDQRRAHVNLPKLGEAVQGDLEVEQVTDTTGRLKYVGKRLLTFGFKAFSLKRDYDNWAIKGILPGEALLGPGEPPDAIAPQILDDGWIELAVQS